MPKTSDMQLGKTIMGLFLGRNGSGKTLAAASYPGDTKFFDFDGRMQPVRTYFPNRKDIEYETFGPDNLNLFADTFPNLLKRCDYRNIIIDSATSFSVTCIAFQMNNKGSGIIKKTKGGLAVPSWDEFNGESAIFSQTLDVCKALQMRGINVIWTAHPVKKTEIIEGEKSRRYESITAVGAKVPDLIPNYFNEIYNFAIEPDATNPNLMRRLVRTSPGSDAGGNIVLAKTALRLPPLIDWTDKPTRFYSIMQTLMERVAEKGEYDETLETSVVEVAQTQGPQIL